MNLSRGYSEMSVTKMAGRNLISDVCNRYKVLKARSPGIFITDRSESGPVNVHFKGVQNSYLFCIDQLLSPINKQCLLLLTRIRFVQLLT